jgi:voltage-gated potassium channel
VQDATKVLSLVIYFGVLAFQIWIAERVFSAIFRKEGRGAWKTMVNEATLDTIRDHFIVCGYGEVGRTVVEQLRQMKIPFALIEKNEMICKALMLEGVPVVLGDANRKTSLTAAGIDRAHGICIVIDNDSDNLYITITAKAMNPKLRIITRAGRGRYARAMKNSGADEVIIPEYEGGIMVGKMITKHSNT